MKGEVFGIIMLAAIALGIGTIVYGGGFGGQLFAVTGENTKCVLTTDYQYIACVENPNGITDLLTNAQWFQCPTYATRCMVTNGALLICSSGNTCYWTWDFSRIVEKGDTMEPGEWGLTVNQYAGTFYPTPMVKHYETALTKCGTSVCSAYSTMYPVPGADHCSFNIDKTIYDSSGAVVAPKAGAFSHVLPFGYALAYPDRTYCTYVPTCSSDSDCASYGEFQGTYNGQTIGYSIQTPDVAIYGCLQKSVQIPKSTVGEGVGARVLDYQTTQQGDCGVKLHITTAQCKPGTSTCGPTATCKDMGNLNFQCVQSNQVECSYDWQCGTSVVRDIFNHRLVTDQCVDGHCAKKYDDKECVDSSNCPMNWYCGTDYKCYESTQQKVLCPNECCAGDPRYYNKVCSPGFECCAEAAGNSCKESCSGTDDDCGFWLQIPGTQSGIPDIFCLIGKWWAMYGTLIVLVAVLAGVLLVVVILK